MVKWLKFTFFRSKFILDCVAQTTSQASDSRYTYVYAIQKGGSVVYVLCLFKMVDSLQHQFCTVKQNAYDVPTVLKTNTNEKRSCSIGSHRYMVHNTHPTAELSSFLIILFLSGCVCFSGFCFRFPIE